MRPSWVFLVLATALNALAADHYFPSYETVKPILDAQRDQLPARLRNAKAADWRAWSRQRDKAIRARLEQGDLESMVNLLLLGTSFTKQPRIRMKDLAEASRSGILRARVDDLVAGILRPADNGRLLFLGTLLRNNGIDLGTLESSPEAGVFILQNLQRIVQERVALLAAEAKLQKAGVALDPAQMLDRRSLYSKRGLSLDTGLFSSFSIEQGLLDLKTHGLLREGQVSRVAAIGPGLDFIDKNEKSSYDFYPEQTVQPFALYDSVVRLGLAKSGAVSVSVFDISSRVIDHIQESRARARKKLGYAIQLPRDVDGAWSPPLLAYWRTLGDRIGTAVEPIEPPQLFRGLDTRAVQIRPEVVLASDPSDFNVILQRVNLAPSERFDLVIATNVFPYYEPFEQALALENIGALLKPGGFLLTNDRLPEVPGGSMRLAGVTVVNSEGSNDAVGWYQKR